MFCPVKTRTPEIRCARCPQGAVERSRDVLGAVFFGFFLLSVLAYLASKFFRNRVARWQAKLEEISNDIFTKRENERQEKELQQRLARIRPQLEIINRRLRHGHMSSFSEEASASYHSTSSQSHASNAIQFGADGEILFDAAEVFDAIDVNCDGILTFEELNSIMQLDDLVLKDFMRRMNARSSDDIIDEQVVTKTSFVPHFLEVLEETSHFRPTPEEAMALWDKMYEALGDTTLSEVPFDNFYFSTLARFLTDVQIRHLVIELLKAKETEKILDDRHVTFKGSNFLLGSRDFVGVSRETFCKYYPTILEDILEEQVKPQESTHKVGIDMTFQNLTLVVKAGKQGSVNVVDNISGRLQKGTMTALLGGSGAGKTSLLNALCGRAYYGEVHGDIFINGHRATVDEFTSSIGFVPQDDIVYAELTVRENFIFSGRFRLPRDTPLGVIEELADSVLAKLGLSRKANSIVGDVTRRGVSGGEKKRVNIGLELMAKPEALFLDEPTSGLDASSALLVMTSLNQLVAKEGMTVCSVIHQPRKFIFDLFNAVILLGAGGRMVYHGPVDGALDYFTALGYTLPLGESVADWLIDISTGRESVDRRSHGEDATVNGGTQPENKGKLTRSISDGLDELTSVRQNDAGNPSRLPPTLQRKQTGNRPRRVVSISFDCPVTEKIGLSAQETGFELFTDEYQSLTPRTRIRSRQPIDEVYEAEQASVASRIIMPIREPTRTDSHVVMAAGPSSKMADRSEEEAKVRRELLFASWNEYFRWMSADTKAQYEPPKQFALPKKIEAPTFWTQFCLQIKRIFLLSWRNGVVKVTDTAVIVLSVAAISLLDGVVELSGENLPPMVPFEAFINVNRNVIVPFFPNLFSFAMNIQIEYINYGMTVGLIASILIAMTCVKTMTEKRLEFFREAGSGYDVNAYFLAINVSTTIEQGIQILITAIIAQWARASISSAFSFHLAFLLFGWVIVSWALLIALVAPPESTMVILGCYMGFFGQLFGGTTKPGTYESKTVQRVFSQMTRVRDNFSRMHLVVQIYTRQKPWHCLPPSFLLLASSLRPWLFLMRSAFLSKLV